MNRETHETHETLARLFACKSAEEVAELLEAWGVTGIPNDPYFCPIAYLVRDVAETDVLVHGGIITILHGGVARSVFAPRAVRDFIYRFDTGEFPQLVRRK